MKYIIANWKAHKTLKEAEEWMDSLLLKLSQSEEVDQKLENGLLKMIIASPLPFLAVLTQKIIRKNIELSAQNLSLFEEGAYTGETTAKMLQGIISYTLLGHSERREYFGESDADIQKKAELSLKYGITPVVCIQNESGVVPTGSIVAYDPKEAIGTGKNILVEDVVTLKNKLNIPKNTVFLYGGSVNQGNIESYSRNAEIDGFLVGGASLDPEEFFSLVQKI